MNSTGKKKTYDRLSDFSSSYRKQIERYQAKHPGASIAQAREGIYEQRIQKAAAKNPDLSLSAARGHKAKALPETAQESAKLERALRDKAGQIRLKQKLGLEDPAKVKEADKLLRSMARAAKKMVKEESKTVAGPSELEWHMFSQKQKDKELQYKAIMGEMPESTSEEARQLIKEMQKETKAMWAKYPPRNKDGTRNPAYYDAQDRMAAIYNQLEALGVVNRTGDILHGDIGYH